MHDLPIWFLVLALILPRLSLFIGWFQGWTFPVPQPGSAFCWFFLPRLLVLMMLYTAQGFSPWFWIHLAALLIVWIRSYVSAASERKKVK